MSVLYDWAWINIFFQLIIHMTLEFSSSDWQYFFFFFVKHVTFLYMYTCKAANVRIASLCCIIYLLTQPVTVFSDPPSASCRFHIQYSGFGSMVCSALMKCMATVRVHFVRLLMIDRECGIDHVLSARRGRYKGHLELSVGGLLQVRVWFRISLAHVEWNSNICKFTRVKYDE
jgi:hypothetical protein